MGKAGRTAECHVRFRMLVLCYYSDWKVLWVLWDGSVRYLEAGSDLPMESGKWYDFDGFGDPVRQKIAWPRTRITPVPDMPVPAPERLRPDLSNLAEAANGFAEIEGVVDEQSELDGRHFQLNVVFGGTHATVFVGLGAADPIPLLRGSIIRVQGVLSVKQDVNLAQPKIEFWCATSAALVPVGLLASDARFNRPLTPIENLREGGPDQRVLVSGTVHRQRPGQSVTLRDDTGQIEVLTHQLHEVREGEAIEAIGTPVRQGLGLTLVNGLFRRRNKGAAEPMPSLQLRLADQVRTLAPADIAEGRDARIGGVVTWSSPQSRFFFVQDATAGAKIVLPAGYSAAVPTVGTGLVVHGHVRVGEFAPIVEATRILPGENIAMPEGELTSWEEAMTGANDGRWIEMTGYVRAVTRTPEHVRAEVTTSRGEFIALLPPASGAELVGAVVRLRGVCDAVANDRRQLTAIRLLVPGTEFIRIVESAPSDPFATRVDSIGNLMRYNPITPLNRRVQVKAVVLLHVPGQLVYVQDGADALTVLSRQRDPLQPGDRVALVGIPGQEGGRLIMRDAVYRRLSSGSAPLPTRLAQTATPQVPLDGQLVRVEGVLLSRELTREGGRLQLQDGSSLFSVRLSTGDNGSAYAPGSRLGLTGVYRVELDEYRRPRGFVLHLRSPADVDVIAQPAWWTATRVLWVAGIGLALALVAMGWGLLLARKNDQLKRAQGELQRANEGLEARVAERTHDLTVEVQHRRTSESQLAAERLLLRTLIDNLPVFLYVKDAAGRFVIGNLPHARLLGAETCAEVIGKTESDFWPPALAALRQRSDAVVVESGEALTAQEEPYEIGGRRGWHSTTRVPLRNASGEITGLIAIAQDITVRKEVEAERESLHRQLLETSRHAGMAEVATGVLHNIGNVLNSVNISATMVAETVTRSKSEKLGVLVDLFAQHQADLPGFFANDKRAQRIPEYLGALARQLRGEQAEVLRELGALQRHIDHIKDVVAMQQSYAKVSGVTERIPVRDLIEDALRINREGLERHGVEVVRELRVNPTIIVERHKALQILVNIISNAKYACDEALAAKRVTVRVDETPAGIAIAVVDTGVGIPAENLTRIFSHGFTTRKNGHGFGLHSGAIAARDLGGALTVTSDGPGCGATFTLEIPLAPPGLTPEPEHAGRAA